MELAKGIAFRESRGGRSEHDGTFGDARRRCAIYLFLGIRVVYFDVLQWVHAIGCDRQWMNAYRACLVLILVFTALLNLGTSFASTYMPYIFCIVLLFYRVQTLEKYNEM